MTKTPTATTIGYENHRLFLRNQMAVRKTQTGITKGFGNTALIPWQLVAVVWQAVSSRTQDGEVWRQRHGWGHAARADSDEHRCPSDDSSANCRERSPKSRQARRRGLSSRAVPRPSTPPTPTPTLASVRGASPGFRLRGPSRCGPLPGRAGRGSAGGRPGSRVRRVGPVR